MPANVRWFEGLMYAAFAVELVSFALLSKLTVSNVAINIVGFSVLSALVWFAARRRQNWIKLMLFFFFILLTAGALLATRGYLQRPMSGLAKLAVTLLELAAFACVFLGDSKGWFDTVPQQSDVPVN
ncbi:MAG TPA: hypothetical protein VHZ78_10780 [Rhizomicrobium sp.]|jgi:hypothetical protein|nr:hypothetical protein [Rhizomicrobium sp.]